MTSEENGQRIHPGKINFPLFAREAEMVAREMGGGSQELFWYGILAAAALVLLLALVILVLAS